MKRWVFNIVAVLSLLLCVAMAVLWVRSYWVSDTVYYSFTTDITRRHLVTLDSVTGQLAVSVVHAPVKAGQPEGFSHDSLSMGSANLRSLVQGLWNFRCFNADGLIQSVSVPTWVAMALVAILPVTWAIRRRRQQRRLKQCLCLHCGYDLRASKERCPECGTAMPRQTVGA